MKYKFILFSPWLLKSPGSDSQSRPSRQAKPKNKLPPPSPTTLLLMDKILHDLKDSKLWELWYIPYNG